jgi:transcriptional regulator with XRE-family HTH domain
METVGAYLKKERESKNISLGEVSRLTKISESYLECIEKDQLEKLPQGPYVKGYIASYSRLIGGNVDQAIKLYEALNKKKIQNEAAQPEIAKHDVGNSLPEKAKTNEQKKSSGSLFGKTKMLLNTVASPVAAKATSFKAAGVSIKKIGSSIQKSGNWFDIVASFFKKIAKSWSWLYALLALLGTGILVLAGIGFFHLFIYNPNPLSVAELQHVQDKQSPPLPATGAEKSVLPSTSTDVSSRAEQLKGHDGSAKSAETSNPFEAQKQSSPLASDPDAVRRHTKSKSQGSTAVSKPAKQTGTLLSDSSSTAKDPVLSPSTDVKAIPTLPDQGQITTGQPEESTTTDAVLKVLRASVCSEIKNRMPVGVDTAFPVSTQRIFVWNEIEARQVPSKIRHIYYLDGRKISDVSLDVRSAYWRTWSAKGLSDDRYRGEWRVDIATASGKVLRRLYFVVR